MATRTRIKPDRYQLKRWVLAALLLGCLAGTKKVLFRVPVLAEAYHRRVAAAADASPAHFGPWVSLDAPVPEAAMTMLRPNATISRKYTNVETGDEATLLLIQCRDARDLFGHYPPVCYAAHGYRAALSVPRDWQVDGLNIHGMAYTFSSTRPDEMSSMIIYDFMVLPNGTTCRDMDGVYASARDPRLRKLGAAQLQVLLSATASEEQRDAIFVSLLRANRSAVDAILAGEKRS